MAEDIISTAWVRIRAIGKDLGADVRKVIDDATKSSEGSARDAGTKTGSSFGDGFTKGADGRLRDSRGKFVSAGSSAGESFGDGFTRGADGRLRDAKGKFVADGKNAGDGFSLGFGNSLNKLAVNIWSLKTIGSAMKQVTGPALIATKAIGIAGAAGAAVALSGAAIGVVGALSQIAGVAPVAVAGLGAMAAVIGTVKLSTMGMSQAFKDSTSAAASTAAGQKKIAADMKGLAPSAAALVTQVLALKPAFTSLQQGVQGNFFAGLAGNVKSLAGTFLPQLRVGLGGIATSLNGIVRSGAGALSGGVLGGGGLTATLGHISAALNAAKPGLIAMVDAFTRIGVTGSKYLPQVAGLMSTIAVRFDAFIAKADASGKLDAFIQGGIAAFKQLAGIVGNLVVGIGNVFAAAAPLGDLLLGKFALLAQGFKAITTSTGKNDEFSAFFTDLTPILSTLGTLLATVVKALEPLLPIVLQVAQVLGQGLIKAIKDLSPGLVAMGKIVLGLAGPLTLIVDAIAQGLSSALVSLTPLIKPVAAAFVALAPVVTALVSNILTPFPPLLAAIAKAFQILAPVLTPVINILGTLINGVLAAATPVLGVLVTLIGGLLLAAVKALQPVLPTIVAAFTKFGDVLAGSLAPLLPPLVKAFSELLLAFLPMVAPLLGILTVITPLAAIFLQFVANLLPPLIKFLTPLAPVIVAVAAAWALWNLALATNPIVLIGLAIAGLVVGIIELVKHFDVVIDFFTKTLPNAFMAALNWIKANVPGWVLPFIPFIGLPILIWEHWSAIVGALSSVFTTIKNAFATAFGAIATAASATWSVITAIFNVGMKVLEIAGKVIFALVVGPFILAWDALKIATTALWGWIGPYVMTAIHAVDAVISAGLHAIEATWNAIWGAIKTAAATIWHGISAFFTAAWNAFSTLVHTVWQGWVNIATAIWGTIGAPVKAAWRTLSGWLSAAWSAFSTAVSGSWHAIVSAATGAWSAITAPIKRTWNTISGWLSDTWSTFKTTVGKAWSGIAGKITGAFSGVAGAISSAWNGIKSAFTTPINWIINKVIDPFLDAISTIPGVPKWHVDPISTGGGGGGAGGAGGAGGVSGRGVQIPGFASGGDVPPHGMAWVGERGKELIQGAAGARVYPHHQSMQMARKMGRIPGYFLGGIVNGIKDIGDYTWSTGKSAGKATVAGARDLAGTAVGGIVRGAEHAANSAISHIPGADMFKSMANGIMGKVADGVENFIKGKGSKQPAGGISMPKGSAVGRWAPTVASVLAQLHQPANLLNAFLSLIGFESGGNPTAINKTDINWQHGTPSVGLAQVIGPTFAAHAGPYLKTGPFAYDVSENPKANVYAGMNYGIDQYGSIANIPGIKSVEQGGAYRPYDQGGWLNPGDTMAVNNTGRKEAVMPQDVMANTIRQEMGGMADSATLLAQIEAHLANISAFTAATAAGNGGDTYGGPTY